MSTRINSKYGVTEQKKQEIDTLSQQVLDAQCTVQQLEAIVTSLTAKSTKLQQELVAADNNRTKALSNKDLMNEIVENLLDLKNNSEVVFNETVLADAKIKTVAKEINDVINKLIYSAEVINKLANLVIRKKAINPLISDELVTMVTKAGTDANNAVSLTLVALKSVFTAQATTLESEAAITLELLQVTKLYELAIGKEVDGIKNKLPKNKKGKNVSIEALLDYAYAFNEKMYNMALTASRDTTKQLNNVKRDLSGAQVRLNSLEAGLAAANAAALAS
jgi:hypothetical protein